jgi:hypothetical protein
MEPVKWARLPFQFDPELLREDLRSIEARPWTQHFNQFDYSGEWSGVALRSPSGSPADIFPRPGCTNFQATEALARCGYFRRVMETLECPLKAVRLLRLHLGSAILEHADADLRFEDGEMRIHVPVQTNPDVEFVVAGKRLILNEGECWYIDFSLPHRVHNRGATDRIHLVIDAQVNDWARAVIDAAARDQSGSPHQAPERGAFDDFRQQVFEDPSLQAPLLKTDGRAAFASLCVVLGRKHGFLFGENEVEAALNSGARAWSEGRIRV